MGQSVIGALRVNLGLDSAKFESGAKRVNAPLRAMRQQFLAVAGVAAAMGAALAAAALKGASEIDRAAKSARRLDASVGAFRALELAAGEAGVSLAGLANDIQTMNRELATIGTSGNADRALERLNLSAADLAGLDADEKVATIADAIKAMGLDAGQATAVLRDLGVRNREMALLMIQGGDAIRAARADVESYGLALDSVEAGKIEAANDKIARLGLISQYAGQQLALALVPAFGAVAQAMTDSLRAGGLLRAMIDGLVSNLDRLGTYLAVAVTGFGVRYVGALVAARLATFTFSGALTFLRGALIRTGIGALVVGAGELVYQFSRLVTAAGGFGGAFALVGDVAAEVLSRLGIALQASRAAISGVWLGIKADGLDAMAGIVSGGVEFANRYIGVYRGAFGAIKALWSALPAVIGSVAFAAANALVGAVEAMINAVVGRMNNFVGKLNNALSLLPEWATGGAPLKIGVIGEVSLGGVENPFAGAAEAAGAEAAGAFWSGFNTNTIAAADTSGLTAAADAARSAGENAALAGSALTALATAPLQSVGALRDSMSEAAEATNEAAGAAEDLAENLAGAGDGTGGGGGGGGGVKKAAKETKEAVKEMSDAAKSAADSIRSSFTDAFKSVVTRAQTFGEAVAGVLQKLADMALTSVGDFLFSGLSGVLGGALGSIPGHANGTDFAAGGLAWVGEQGRELVNLPRGSQVIPNHKLDQLGGQMAVQVVPSPYFDVQVSRISRQASAPMIAGVAEAGRRSHGAMSEQFFKRGTTL
ncbi:hypothetical protein [Salipiger sp.]|uniref:hypothetical protein n=1 Tax=Salipiger sp. TaxID=2078585 RepID=UPI003A985470